MRVLVLLLAAAASAADVPFSVKGIFSAQVPEGWIARDAWRPPAPAADFVTLEPDGEHRLSVHRYAKDNPLKMTQARFMDALLKDGPPVKETVGKRSFDVFKGRPQPASSWETPHHDPDEPVLGPGGGDFSRAGRLRRCREKGAWDDYAWYREARGKPDEMRLFRKYFTAEDKKVLELCLGPAALATIEGDGAPDPAVRAPTDAELEAAAQDAPPAPKAREASVHVRPAKDGFFVLRYESPAGGHGRHYGAFLRLLATFEAR